MIGRKRSLLYLLFVVSTLWLSPLYSQSLDHLQGEILVRVVDKAFPTTQFHQLQNELDFNLYDKGWVAEAFQVRRLQFDHTLVNEQTVLSFIQKQPWVQSAQFDYFVEHRTLPDDPLFSQLWHLYNTGQNGGTYGVDLNVAAVWQQIQGGNTFFGDTIVICVIDDGFEVGHPDFAANIWINHAEIPGNGQDDDGNLFVDDYLGWNASDGNDEVHNLSGEEHGTQVMGIAGASGNNGLGISGINWNVKLMMVKMGGNVGDVLAAYSYPFVNRQLYNDSNGTQGAFVVATNSSWGIDYGSPDDMNLWCEVYDLLGEEGILNAAATTNLNIDVDQQGDMPTACTSDFLISVTSVDHHDVKYNPAGYGQTHVDLGSFGVDIWSTQVDAYYGAATGTSMATPQVSGAIGLLYNSPCPSFSHLAKSNPQEAALKMRDYLLDGVSENTSLSGITASGGRLDIESAYNHLMLECTYEGCFPPFNLYTSDLTAESATLHWQDSPAANVINLRYRPVGSPAWIIIEDIDYPYTFSNLSGCTYYEVQMQSVCDNESSDYSALFSFLTDACCIAPPIIEVTEVTTNSISLSWDPVSVANNYVVEIRESGTFEWLATGADEPEISIGALELCTAYDFRIKTNCNDGTSNYTPILTLVTMGCSPCQEHPYCPIDGPQSNVWISHFEIGDFVNDSENPSNAYSSFTDLSIPLSIGSIHEIQIETEFEFFEIDGHFNIWIDFNQDGFFDNEEEQVFNSVIPGQSANGFLFIPNTAELGSTRMRVAFREDHYDACVDYFFAGEVEDYCIDIIENTDCLPPLNVNHSILGNSIQIEWLGNLPSDEYLIFFRPVGESDWVVESSAFSNAGELDNLAPCTDYEYYIVAVCDGENSQPSELQAFTTQGCGSCLDHNYCHPWEVEAAFEWIAQVGFNNLNHFSENNNGYCHVQEQVADLALGSNYVLTLRPGFASSTYEEAFTVWIDFSQDGTFDENELIYSGVSFNGETILANVEIPMSTLEGTTRMRVLMKNTDAATDPCIDGFFGEIEDYCVNLFSPGSFPCNAPNDIFATVNTSNHSVYFSWLEIPDAISYTLRYREWGLEDWTSLTSTNSNCLIENLDSCADYEYQVRTICDFGLSNFSTPQYFNTCEVITSSFDLNASQATIDVFPNPFRDQISLTFSSSITIQRLSLLDLQGKQLLQTIPAIPNTASQYQWRLNQSLPAGIYFLEVIDSGGQRTVKKLIHQVN